MRLRVGARTKAWWLNLGERPRHFALNIAIGIIISVVVATLETNAAVSKLRDSLLTWQVGQLAATGLGRDILWLDIDDATYVRWHAPTVTPRDRLCRLIDFAVRGHARAIIVDVDLTDPTPLTMSSEIVGCRAKSPPRQTASTGADDELKRYLVQYARDCRAVPSRHCAPIVLTRQLRSSYRSQYENGVRARTPRRSFLDDPAIAESDVVLWGTTTFDEDDDAMIRRWRLWEPVCDPPEALPSSVLLAASASLGSDARDVRTMLERVRPVCARAGTQPHPNTSVQDGSDKILGRVSLSTDGMERRFFYRVAWDADRSRPTMNAYVPGTLVADADARHPYDTAIANDRIVVIGGSFSDNPDFHRTPIGTLPGTLIMINAMQSLISDDRLHEVPVLLRVTIEGTLITVVSLIFLYFSPGRAMLASSALVVCAALTIGYAFLNRGYWIDPVLPLVAIQVHELVGVIEHHMKSKGASDG